MFLVIHFLKFIATTMDSFFLMKPLFLLFGHSVLLLGDLPSMGALEPVMMMRKRMKRELKEK